MKKYFLIDGTERTGPFDAADLKLKNITPETPVWYEGLAEPLNASQVEELKDLFTPVPLPLPTEEPLPTVEEVKPVVTTPVAPVVPVTTTTATAVAAAAPPVAKTVKPRPAATTTKKGTAWISWVAMLLVLGGAGYLVYQDLEKNKSATAGIARTETTSDTVSTTTPTTTTTTTDPSPDTAATTTTDATDPVTTTTITTHPTKTTGEQTAAEKAAATKKAEEEKKKLAAKKAEADKKKQDEAKAAAAAAREMEQRNKWTRYITFGSLNYTTKGDGIQAFDVPVYNGTDGMLDKVTIRIEYLKKKETKIYKTETITIYNIPARTTMNGKAPESKKGEKVNVFITSVASKRLHFCYPQNNGNADDPYFCN